MKAIEFIRSEIYVLNGWGKKKKKKMFKICLIFNNHVDG